MRSKSLGALIGVRQDRYDINGRPDLEGEPNLAQQQEMIQKLLTDRFGLKFHRETREMPVYGIRVAKGGPRLPPPAHPERKPVEQSDSHGDFDRIHNYESAPISYLIMVEQLCSDRPLVDQTGLTGKYDFRLQYDAMKSAIQTLTRRRTFSRQCSKNLD